LYGSRGEGGGGRSGRDLWVGLYAFDGIGSLRRRCRGGVRDFGTVGEIDHEKSGARDVARRRI
jgi:hypothetical protein